MSAVIVPFKPRPDGAVAAVAPAYGTARILEYPSHPHSLADGDISALEALAPTLGGVWTCEILVNDNDDKRAVFKDHDASALMFFVGRSSGWLRLFNKDGEAIVTYDKIDALTTELGKAFGRRPVASV
jgi:hypothetical protein